MDNQIPDKEISRELVSIIIPTWNRVDFLRDALESVRRQTYQQWEVIVIDDGSDDGTEAMVRSFNDARMHYYWFAHTGILSVLRNAGLAKARGIWIAFLDSDDLWKPEKLSKQLTLLKQHPGADFIIGNAEEFGDGSIDTLEHDSLVVGDLFHPILVHGKYCYYVSPFMFKAKVIDDLGTFDEKTQVACDAIFFFRLSQRSSGIFSNEKLVRIRKHKNNFSLTNGTRAYQDTLMLLDQFRADKSIKESLYRQLAARAHYSMAVEFANGRSKQARKHFLKAFKLRPTNIKALVRSVTG